jgi:chromosome segregation ATPase
LVQARRHELEMIHQELEHIDEWLDQQRSQLDALLFGGQPISHQPSEAELQQSRERLAHDDAAVEQGIESILEHIRAQIHNLTHHKARSTVRPPRRFTLSWSLSLWRLTMVANGSWCRRGSSSRREA